MEMPAAVGASLPLPTSLSDIAPGSFDSLQELSGGRDLLVLVSSLDSAMTDRLRQTLVALQEVVAPLGAQAAAVSLVGGPAYRKLARKTKVDYPLLSDPGRDWLRLLPQVGGVSVYILAVPSAVVLGRFGTDTEASTPQDVADAVATALGKGRAALETEAASRAKEARAAVRRLVETPDRGRRGQPCAACPSPAPVRG